MCTAKCEIQARKCVVQDENLQSAPGSRVGTPAYLAPEVILTTQGNKYNAKVWPSCALLQTGTAWDPLGMQCSYIFVLQPNSASCKHVMQSALA